MLKKLYFLLFFLELLLTQVTCDAQSSAVGVHLSAFDLYGPQSGNYFFHNSKNGKSLHWDPAFQISYWKSFSKHADFKASVSLSSLYMPATNNDSTYLYLKEETSLSNQKLPLASIYTGGVFSFLPKNKFIVTPQADAGIGYYFQTRNSGVNIHAGLGFNFRLAKNVSLLINSAYHYSLSNKYQSYLQHSAGFMYYFGKETKNAKKEQFNRKDEVEKIKVVKQTRSAKRDKAETPAKINKEETIPPLPLPIDTDNDGTPDSEDACITEPGKKAMKGCPDKDKDGVADNEDACPDIKGSATAKGCPDADGDGIADENDKCPSEYGKDTEGCPVIEKGPIEPDSLEIKEILEEALRKASSEKINAASKQILFNSGTAYIHPTSYVALDTIVNVLKRDTLFHIDIEGHTDNTGNAEKNIQLSQERADACKEYLIKHGIAENRISSVGYGDMKPIADNNTNEGRTINRRTEFLLFIPKK